MKRFGCVVLATLLILCCVSCEKTPLLIEDATETPTVIQTENRGKYYGGVMRLAAIDLVSLSENDTGFSVVGTEADKNRADYVKQMFENYGLTNITEFEFSASQWLSNTAILTHICSCAEFEELTTMAISPYPINFVCDNEEYEVVYVGSGTEGNFAQIDAKDKAVLVDTDENLDEIILRAEAAGASLVLVTFNSVFNINSYRTNITSNTYKYTIPVLGITRTEKNRINDTLNHPDLVAPLIIKVTANVEIKSDGVGRIITADLVGTDPNSIIYVTTNRDSINSGFFDTGVNFGEMLVIAENMRGLDTALNSTIRFVVTTGDVWGSVSSDPLFVGTKAYINALQDKENIKGVLVIDGSVPIPGQSYVAINYTSDMKSLVTNYTAAYRIENRHKFVEQLHEITDTEITEGLLWADAGIPTIIQATTGTDDYTYIKGTYDDNVMLVIDETHAEYIVDFYTGLLCNLDIN